MPNHKNKKLKNKLRLRAFTLIELLVVIGIIGLLASILLVAVKNAIVTAKVNKTQDDLHQIEKQIEIVRDQKNETLGQITGDYYTVADGGCSGYPLGNPSPKSYQNLPASNPCYIWLNQQFQKLGFVKVPIDPYGAPYVMDENEGEFGYGSCGSTTTKQDLIASVGPDGMWGDADDRGLIVPYFQCQ